MLSGLVATAGWPGAVAVHSERCFLIREDWRTGTLVHVEPEPAQALEFCALAGVVVFPDADRGWGQAT